MDNLKKVGLTALAGSLAAVSAHAAFLYALLCFQYSATDVRHIASMFLLCIV